MACNASTISFQSGNSSFRACRCIGIATVDFSPCAVANNASPQPCHRVAIGTLQPFRTSSQSAFVGTVPNNVATLQILFSVCCLFQIVCGQDSTSPTTDPWRTFPAHSAKGLLFLRHRWRRLLVHNSTSTPIPWQLCFLKPFWSTQ